MISFELLLRTDPIHPIGFSESREALCKRLWSKLRSVWATKLLRRSGGSNEIRNRQPYTCPAPRAVLIEYAVK